MRWTTSGLAVNRKTSSRLAGGPARPASSNPGTLAYLVDASDAARAWDDAVREHGLQDERGLNFPRDGERSWAEIEAERQAARERRGTV